MARNRRGARAEIAPSASIAFVGGGGEGGGGGTPIVGGGGGSEPDDPWQDWGVFGGPDHAPPAWRRRAWIRENVPGYSDELWKTPTGKADLLRRALEVWQRIKLADPRSGFRNRVERLERRGRLDERLGPAAAASARAILANQATQPGPGRQFPTIPPSTGQEPAWLRLLRLVLDQVNRYRTVEAERDQQRAQRRGMRMSLSDTIGDVLGTVTTAGAAILPQLLQQRAADAAVKQQLKLARLGFGGSMSGVPVAGGLGGGLLALLGEQGAMESSDLLEQLGLATGLEGAVEREATFYVPTASGVRAVPEIQARNPVTGRINTWKNMGRPVLFSGDLATCKRVNKISARVGRVARRRGMLPRRRR